PFDAAMAQQRAAQVLAGRQVQATLPYSISAGHARPYKQIAEYMKSVLGPLGIVIPLQQPEDAALSDVTNRGEWNLRFSQLGWANGGPDFIKGNFPYSQGAANTTSHGAYHNDEVDQLLVAGRQERDPAKRFSMYERLQENRRSRRTNAGGVPREGALCVSEG